MIKILQYSTGNFLRAFADRYFETLNREQKNYEVHVATNISGDLGRFEVQKNRCHVILRGVDAGAPVDLPVSGAPKLFDKMVEGTKEYMQEYLK